MAGGLVYCALALVADKAGLTTGEKNRLWGENVQKSAFFSVFCEFIVVRTYDLDRFLAYSILTKRAFNVKSVALKVNIHL